MLYSISCDLSCDMWWIWIYFGFNDFQLLWYDIIRTNQNELKWNPSFSHVTGCTKLCGSFMISFVVSSNIGWITANLARVVGCYATRKPSFWLPTFETSHAIHSAGVYELAKFWQIRRQWKAWQCVSQLFLIQNLCFHLAVSFTDVHVWYNDMDLSVYYMGVWA